MFNNPHIVIVLRNAWSRLVWNGSIATCFVNSLSAVFISHQSSHNQINAFVCPRCIYVNHIHINPIPAESIYAISDHTILNTEKKTVHIWAIRAQNTRTTKRSKIPRVRARKIRKNRAQCSDDDDIGLWRSVSRLRRRSIRRNANIRDNWWTWTWCWTRPGGTSTTRKQDTTTRRAMTQRSRVALRRLSI